MAAEESTAPAGEQDAMAAEWAAALAEAKPETASELQPAAEQVAPASFTNFSTNGAAPAAGNDINMILDIPVQLTVELGRTRIPIKHILQLAQGSVVELDALAGEPMDVLVNGYLIAQGEVVVVNDKFGIRLTDIVTPSERMRRLSNGADRADRLERHAERLDVRRLTSLLWFIAHPRDDPGGPVAAQAHADRAAPAAAGCAASRRCRCRPASAS